MTDSKIVDGLLNRRVFFDPLRGNHGDQLIRLAADDLLKKHAVTLVKTPAEAEVILLNGGGAMTDGWFGLKKLANYNNNFPHKPLVVWPSSFLFSQTDMAAIFSSRSSSAHLWAREQPSLELLEQAQLPSSVSLSLAPDLAFRLSDHPKIKELDISQKRPLIVERDDWEGVTGRRRIINIPALEVIPKKWRTAARRRLLGARRERSNHSDFSKAALDFLAQQHPEESLVEPVLEDVSLPEVCEFQGFLKLVASASLIVTTRLHVAILGHLLKKPTYLVNGSYHKYRGIFEYSLSGGSSRLVQWVPDEKRLVLLSS